MLLRFVKARVSPQPQPETCDIPVECTNVYLVRNELRGTVEAVLNVHLPLTPQEAENIAENQVVSREIDQRLTNVLGERTARSAVSTLRHLGRFPKGSCVSSEVSILSAVRNQVHFFWPTLTVNETRVPLTLVVHSTDFSTRTRQHYEVLHHTLLSCHSEGGKTRNVSEFVQDYFRNTTSDMSHNDDYGEVLEEAYSDTLDNLYHTYHLQLSYSFGRDHLTEVKGTVVRNIASVPKERRSAFFSILDTVSDGTVFVVQAYVTSVYPFIRGDDNYLCAFPRTKPRFVVVFLQDFDRRHTNCMVFDDVTKTIVYVEPQGDNKLTYNKVRNHTEALVDVLYYACSPQFSTSGRTDPINIVQQFSRALENINQQWVLLCDSPYPFNFRAIQATILHEDVGLCTTMCLLIVVVLVQNNLQLNESPVDYYFVYDTYLLVSTFFYKLEQEVYTLLHNTEKLSHLSELGSHTGVRSGSTRRDAVSLERSPPRSRQESL